MLSLFVKLNRNEIDKIILKRLPKTKKITDYRRKQWLSRDDELLRWARTEGVDI